MRQLEMDLERETGLALADFDVLAQLALAGGELRMTELAAKALISRSGMTRRVARLVDEGLVRTGQRNDRCPWRRRRVDRCRRRAADGDRADPRARDLEAFVQQLDDDELAVLQTALDKVTLDCTFG